MVSALNDSEKVVLRCAFHYALGRRTYVVSSVAQTIRRLQHCFTDTEKQEFVNDILKHRDTFGNLGGSIDEREWLNLVNDFGPLDVDCLKLGGVVNPQDMSIILFCAFRNALGKEAYIVDAVVRNIFAHWKNFSMGNRELFVREIHEFRVQNKSLGCSFATRAWQSIIERYELEQQR